MPASAFPQAFQCYKPRHHRIYGSICMTPDNRVLAVKGRRTGKWSFPKGHLEGSESSLECALRELKEEAGIDLSCYQPIGCRKLSVGRYFFFEIDQELPTMVSDQDEIEAAEWIPVQRLVDLDCNVDLNAFLDRLTPRAG